MNPEVKDLVLRVHTRIESDKSEPPPKGDLTEPVLPKYASEALSIDCETTTEELGQKLNFAFYQKCKLRNGGYATTEEGIVVADDLERREGKRAVQLLHQFARTHRANTISGKFAKIRIYSRSEFMQKVFFPWAILRKAVIVGAHLVFDLSVCSVAYHEHKTENGFSSELAARYKGKENKRYPRLRDVPKNSRTSFLELSGGTGPYKCGKKFRGRFLDVLTLAFAMRNTHFSLKSACKEWKVPGKLDYKPTGKITLDEVIYCREDVAATLRLLNAQLREYETYPISLRPEKAISPASVAKSFKERMGLERPAVKFNYLPDWIHGVSMSSYCGGRSEVRVRDTLLPGVLVDYTSNYPASAALLNTWELEIAKKLRVTDVTEEARTILASVSLSRLLSCKFWAQLNFMAKVVPDGQLLPARTVFSDESGAEDTNIGLNPLFSSSALWFTGPDLANGVLHGHTIKIVKAIRLDPIGIQDGLVKSIPIGSRIIDPAKDNPYVAWVEEKEVTRGDKRNFIKCLLNAGGYGLAVELNRKRFGKNNSQRIRIWAGENELPPITSTEFEEPGRWYMPWIGSLVTGGGRLLLGIVEKEVRARGASFLMTDTDSMFVIGTEHGGLIPCPGGSYRMLSGTEAVKALSWAEVKQITNRIQKLSPFHSEIRFLKLDKVNFDRNRKQHQLFGLGYSAKRYCLRTEKEIIKPSEHGLGPYFVPAKDDERYWKPEDCLEDKTYLRWVKELWEFKFGMRKTLPKWADYYSMRKYSVTTPNVLHKLRELNRDAAKPHSFCISPVPSFGSGTKVAPYCDRPDRWEDLDYVLLSNGQKMRLSSVHTDDEGRESIVIDDAPHKLRKVVECFSESIEHKSLAPDGSKCTATTKGPLRRRPIRASSVFHWIGKEVDRGTSTDPECFSDDQKLMRYGTDKQRFPEALRKMSVRELMKRTGLSSDTIQRSKNGKRIHPKTARKLSWCARLLKKPMAKSKLREKGKFPGPPTRN
jgi:hypothetical protein